MKFLDGIKFLEFLDIAQVPMNLDCWRSFSYIDKVYVHTLTCLTAMLLLKPEAIVAVVMVPVGVARACSDWFGRTLFGQRLASWSCVQQVIRLKQRSTKVVVQRANREFKQMIRLARKGNKVFLVQAQALSKNTLGAVSGAASGASKGADGQHQRERNTSTAAVNIRSRLNRTDAAIVLQRLWRHRKPAVIAAIRNITILRRELLSFVSTAKNLSRDDFLLLFSYAVYSALCDTCFMYFDCTPYEDGELYLTADVSITCAGPEAGPYLGSLGYVSVMSILFALGIPLYYVLALYNIRGAVNPAMQSILKDTDYVKAFAISGKKFVDREGNPMTGRHLASAQKAVTEDWARSNPELAASLEGKDYKSQYEQVRARAGYKKAEDFIKRKARAASVPAHRLKFLWVSGTEFERLCCVATSSLSYKPLAGSLQSKALVFRGT
jgi:hypothetical protein